MVTSREIFEGALIELDKIGAPNMQLDEFNYYIQKGVNEYVNLRYNQYDTNQQTTDDLQVLTGSKSITGADIKYIGAGNVALVNYGSQEVKEALYSVKLPPDYYHLLNCSVTYRVLKTFKNWNINSKVKFPAKRLTADMEANIYNNAFLRPVFKRPYYYIKSNERKITGNWAANSGSYNADRVKQEIVDLAGSRNVHNSWEDVNSSGTFNTGDVMTGPTMDINYGTDALVFELEKVEIKYLRYPERVRLTQEQIDSTEDISQVMEFPDYVCQELIKHVVRQILLHNNDPKLQIYDQVNMSIPVSQAQVAPQQQQAQ